MQNNLQKFWGKSKCRICKWFKICKGGCLSDLIDLDNVGGRRGTSDCLNFAIYEYLSDTIINYFMDKNSNFKNQIKN